MPFVPSALARLDTERRRRYRDNLAFYRGDQWPSAPRRRRPLADRLTFNYARALVDKVTAYLMQGHDVAVDPVDDSPEPVARARRAEAVLREVRDAGGLEQLDYETETDCAVLGDACYKVTWDAERGGARVTAPDVDGLFAWWRPDDPRQVVQVAARYRLQPDEARALFGVGDLRAPAWAAELWTTDRFELYLDDRPHLRGPNPYGFIPFVIFPNLREPKQFWGLSDLEQVRESAVELNRALSQLSRILELSGNPVAVLENVQAAEDIAVQPGAVWELPAEARAYLLDLLQGGGVRLHVDYIDLLYRTLHDLAEAPRSAFGENRAGLSGVALNTELDPLMKKVERKRLIRTAAYRRRGELVLRLHERMTGERLFPCRVRPQWGPVLPQDRSRQVADERVLVAAGVHARRTAASALGVDDPEAEFARWLEELRATQTAADAHRPGAEEAQGRDGPRSR